MENQDLSLEFSPAYLCSSYTFASANPLLASCCCSSSNGDCDGSGLLVYITALLASRTFTLACARPSLCVSASVCVSLWACVCLFVHVGSRGRGMTRGSFLMSEIEGRKGSALPARDCEHSTQAPGSGDDCVCLASFPRFSLAPLEPACRSAHQQRLPMQARVCVFACTCLPPSLCLFAARDEERERVCVR